MQHLLRNTRLARQRLCQRALFSATFFDSSSTFSSFSTNAKTRTAEAHPTPGQSRRRRRSDSLLRHPKNAAEAASMFTNLRRLRKLRYNTEQEPFRRKKIWLPDPYSYRFRSLYHRNTIDKFRASAIKHPRGRRRPQPSSEREFQVDPDFVWMMPSDWSWKATVWVDNLAYASQEDEMQMLFEEFGKVKKVKLLCHPNGLPRGKAFVFFESRHSVSNLIGELAAGRRITYLKRPLKIYKAFHWKYGPSQEKEEEDRKNTVVEMWEEENATRAEEEDEKDRSKEGMSPNKHANDAPLVHNKTLFIGGVSQRANERTIREVCGEYGKVDGIKLVAVNDPGYPSYRAQGGFAFVRFSDAAGAEAMHDAYNSQARSSRLFERVEYPRTKPGHPSNATNDLEGPAQFESPRQDAGVVKEKNANVEFVRGRQDRQMQQKIGIGEEGENVHILLDGVRESDAFTADPKAKKGEEKETCGPPSDI